MHAQDSAEKSFHSWLDERMKEPDLSPHEKVEFMRWLMARSCDNAEAGHADSRVTFSDVLQLMGWLGKS